MAATCSPVPPRRSRWTRSSSRWRGTSPPWTASSTTGTGACSARTTRMSSSVPPSCCGRACRSASSSRCSAPPSRSSWTSPPERPRYPLKSLETMADLEIKNLHVSAGDKQILKGVDLHVRSGEFHALMGPNGSGKSTLANVLMGHPNFEVTEGQILLDGEDITEAEPDERARAGLFMAFQYPSAIPGVSVVNFLRTAINAQRKARGEDPINLKNFRKELERQMELLGVDREFTRRYLNEGFSGGEKKRCEILQMAILKPIVAVMDETDSGLDIDALRTVSNAVEKMRGPDLGILIITHYQRILSYIKPDFVHIMLNG